MAIVLGSKLVKDTEKYNDWAIGVVLPIQIGNTGFNQSYTTAVQTKSNIKNSCIISYLRNIFYIFKINL